jgi:glycosyltransferase involved in cell wall biosynthesis
MARITILSDSPMIPTGYSNQSKLLAMFLKKRGHEVHFLANAYQGATIKKAELTDGTIFDFNIYGQGRQGYFADRIDPHLKKTKSDAFIILLDTFMLHGGNNWFSQIDTSPAQTFFWYPSDGGAGMPIGCDSILKKVEVPVAMAEFGKKQVKDYYNINAEHIPHGTEKDRFFKVSEEEKEQLKAKYGLRGSFVVGVVARNQPRKFLDRTLKAFRLVANKIKNAKLFLHLDPNDLAQPWNIVSLIRRYNLENRVVFSGMNAYEGFDWNKMNEVYNVMDVFFLSTSGEGFGIPIIEAMSCEIPVVATDYTTTPELVINNKAGLGARLAGVDDVTMFDKHSKDYDDLVANGTMTGSWEVERGIISINDAADKIEYLYNNPELRKEMGSNGRKAVIEKYDFETVVGPSWEKLILDKLK